MALGMAANGVAFVSTTAVTVSSLTAVGAGTTSALSVMSGADGKTVLWSYIASRVTGIPIQQTPWSGERQDRVIPWDKVFIDPINW